MVFDWSKRKKYGVALGSVLSLMAVLGVLVFFGWLSIPGFLLSKRAFFLFAAVVIFAVTVFFVRKLNQSNDRFPLAGGGRKTKQQLNDMEAYELLRYRLFFYHNMRISEWHQRGPDHVGTPGEEEPIRLYKLVFSRKNVDEKVGVFLDLEQEMDLDMEDNQSLLEASEGIENIRLIRGSKVQDFDGALQDAREELGKNLYRQFGNIREIEYSEDGDIKREKTRPALPNKTQTRRKAVETADEQ